ncbi:MAG: AAA family ATPase [Chloroflexi bacterium]|nr:AAA family ATPase [Chloroflexota bacterium]
MAGTIVGRDAEWTVLERSLDGLATIPTGPRPGRVVVIEGEPGMGKTTLWEAATAAARDRGVRVLDARPTEVEADLAYAGLHDLVREVTDAELGVLPTPQRHALDTALYRGRPEDDPEAGAPEAGVLTVALGSLLHSLSRQAPVLVAVDDIHWLDRASLGPVGAMVRRLTDVRAGLTDARVCLLAAARVPEDGADHGTAGRGAWLDIAWTERVALRPLSMGALHRLLGDRLGISLARPALVRFHALTGGNPLLAIELAGAWGAAAVERAEAGQALPRTLDSLLLGRIDRLEPADRRVAEAVAAIGRPHADLLGRVLDEPDVASLARHAIESGVLATDSDRLRCAHPLIGAALLAALSPGGRRALHGRIAAALDDPVDAARHHAAAAAGPDETVAVLLDRASEVAARRGAGLEAMTLRERALDLTPTDDIGAVVRRRVALADSVFTAGDTERARGILEDTAADHPDVSLDTRLEAGLLHATVHWFSGDNPHAVALGRRALAAAGDDRRWRARINARLSWMMDSDLPEQAAYGAAAVELLDPDEDPRTYAFALLNLAWARLLAGEGEDLAALERGQRLQQGASFWDSSTIPAVWAKAMDRFDAARVLIDHFLAGGRERGDENSVAQLLSMRAELEAWTGRMDLALQLAEESVAAAEQSGQGVYLVTSLARRGLVRAYLGDLDGADADARASLAVARPPLLSPVPLSVLGFVALTRGDPRTAAEHLLAAAAMLDGTRMREPATYRLHGDLVEALVLSGDLDSAAEHVERLEERARVTPRPWIHVIAARSRALLQGAHGDVPGALAAFERVFEAHTSLEMPFELARSQLVHGLALRRSGSRRRAASSMQRALEGFESVGCGPWADRARDELGRVGLQRGHRDALSPREEHIARLAADGMSSRQIGERLSISNRTVESILARAYAKLDISTRAELGSRIAGMDAEIGASDGSEPPSGTSTT